MKLVRIWRRAEHAFATLTVISTIGFAVGWTSAHLFAWLIY